MVALFHVLSVPGGWGIATGTLKIACTFQSQGARSGGNSVVFDAYVLRCREEADRIRNMESFVHSPNFEDHTVVEDKEGKSKLKALFSLAAILQEIKDPIESTASSAEGTESVDLDGASSPSASGLLFISV